MPYLLPAVLVLGAGALAWHVGSEYGPDVIDWLEPKLKTAWSYLTPSEQEVTYDRLKNGQTLTETDYSNLGLNKVLDATQSTAQVSYSETDLQLNANPTNWINSITQICYNYKAKVKVTTVSITRDSSNRTIYQYRLAFNRLGQTGYLNVKFLYNTSGAYNSAYMCHDEVVNESTYWNYVSSPTATNYHISIPGAAISIPHPQFYPLHPKGTINFSYSPTLNVPTELNLPLIISTYEQSQTTQDYTPLKTIYENSPQAIYNIATDVATIVDNTSAIVQSNEQTVAELKKSNTFLGDIKYMLENMQSNLASLWSRISSNFDIKLSSITTSINAIPTKLNEVITAIGAIPTKLDSVITAVENNPQTILDALPEIIGNPTTPTEPGIDPGTVTVTIPELITDVVTEIPTNFQNLIQEIVKIPQSITEIATEVIPNTATDLVNELKKIPEAITDKVTEWIQPSIETDTQPKTWNIFDLLYLLLAVLVATIKVLLSFIGLLTSLQSVPADSSMLPPLVQQGIDFTKNMEMPFFNMTFFTIISAVVTLVIYIKVFKVVRRVFIKEELA